MIDLKFLRDNIDLVFNVSARRGYHFDICYFKELDNNIRKIKTDIQKIRHENKLNSKKFNILKKNNGLVDNLLIEIELLKKKLSENEKKLELLLNDYNKFLFSIPNLIDYSVPKGNSSFDNLEIKLYNSSNKISNNNFDEFILSNINNFIDFEMSSLTSGSGFVFLKEGIATLHRALGNYMLDVHVNVNGYKEIYPPFLVNEKSMYSTGHFPKFYYDQFKIEDEDLWLIPTGEVVLANLARNKTFNHCDLPLKYVTKTPCFRKEKGSYGKMVKGMIRQHQFEKVELLQITEPIDSYKALDEIVFHAESILKGLDLSYRVISLCEKDIGFSSTKTYDLEVWFPMKKTYIEVSSCSNTESFQSVRMNSKFKNKFSNSNDFVHILNGSGLAIGRVLMAIIENYFENNKIVIPNSLKKYMGNSSNVYI